MNNAEIADRTRTAVRDLFVVLQNLGANNSNAPAELTATSRPIELNRRYPDPALVFGNCQWRAYYHCHVDHVMPGEHGHFHIFLQPAPDLLYHVAGLSVDPQGQPMAWFTTNLWVTGGSWLSYRAMLCAIDALPVCTEPGLAAEWLRSMLLVSRHRLQQLYRERDDYALTISGDNPAETLWTDRTHYTLSTRSIDLLAEIEDILQPGDYSASPPGTRQASLTQAGKENEL